MGFHPLCRRLAGLTVALAVGGNALAQEAACPLPDQKPTLVVQMFFGQSIRNRGPVTKKEWNAFLRQTVTPRFPDGFTVYDAYGQWLDTEKHIVTRENSKVIQIATANTEPVRAGIAEISDAYRKRFRQQAVAIVSTAGCASF